MSNDEHSRTDDRDETPTEPRESEHGQEQATDTADGTVAEEERVAGERDTHDEHPDAEGEATHGSVEPATTRTTAPMSAFTGREVGIGVAVLAVGVLIAFVIPLVLA